LMVRRWSTVPISLYPISLPQARATVAASIAARLQGEQWLRAHTTPRVPPALSTLASDSDAEEDVGGSDSWGSDN
jgi:hypothetical protein